MNWSIGSPLLPSWLLRPIRRGGCLGCGSGWYPVPMSDLASPPSLHSSLLAGSCREELWHWQRGPSGSEAIEVAHIMIQHVFRIPGLPSDIVFRTVAPSCPLVLEGLLQASWCISQLSVCLPKGKVCQWRPEAWTTKQDLGDCEATSGLRTTKVVHFLPGYIFTLTYAKRLT